MKKIVLLLLVMVIILRGEGNYRMVFYPSNPNCKIVSIEMRSYRKIKNTYGYDLIIPDKKIPVKRDFDGIWTFLQSPYKKNETWSVYYIYRTGYRKKRNIIKNLKEGEATIYLPCSFSGKIKNFFHRHHQYININFFKKD